MSESEDLSTPNEMPEPNHRSGETGDDVETRRDDAITEVDRLVDRLLGDRLDEEGRQRLNFLLRDDSLCRRRYLARMDDHAATVSWLRRGGGDDNVSDSVTRLQASSLRSIASDGPGSKTYRRKTLGSDWLLSQSLDGQSFDGQSFGGRRRRRFRIAMSSLVAVGAAVLAMMFYSGLIRVDDGVAMRGVRPPMRVASTVSLSGVRIGSCAGAQIFEMARVDDGRMLPSGRTFTLTNGMLTLDFPAGAEAIIEAPAVFRIESDECLAMTCGRCSVHAPDGAEGFRLRTPQSDVVDLGTRFSVDLDGLGVTEVQVIEGEAEVFAAGASGATTRLLSDGEALRLTSGEMPSGEMAGGEMAGGEMSGGEMSGGEMSGGDPANAVAITSATLRPDAYRRYLPDRLVRYVCDETTPPVSRLAGVTVQRGGQIYHHGVDELIRVEVRHFMWDFIHHNVAIAPSSSGREADAGGSDSNNPAATRSIGQTLGGDDLLTTGLINPGGQRLNHDIHRPIIRGIDPATGRSAPGLGVQFDVPVINGPGPDALLFEVQARIHLPGGDGFFVTSLDESEAGGVHHIDQYDISMRSSAAMRVEPLLLPLYHDSDNFLQRDVTSHVSVLRPSLVFHAIATGIDLSDLGYREGQSCTGLFFTDDQIDNDRFDPVFIAGLPTIVPPDDLPDNVTSSDITSTDTAPATER